MCLRFCPLTLYCSLFLTPQPDNFFSCSPDVVYSSSPLLPSPLLSFNQQYVSFVLFTLFSEAQSLYPISLSGLHTPVHSHNIESYHRQPHILGSQNSSHISLSSSHLLQTSDHMYTIWCCLWLWLEVQVTCPYHCIQYLCYVVFWLLLHKVPLTSHSPCQVGSSQNTISSKYFKTSAI